MRALVRAKGELAQKHLRIRHVQRIETAASHIIVVVCIRGRTPSIYFV